MASSNTCKADLVLLGADVITMSPVRPAAQAVAIRRNVVLRVGRDGEMHDLIGPGTEVIQCHGKCLLPGFHDAHIHLLACASQILAVDCRPSAVSSIADIQHAIQSRAELLSAGSWIRANGYDQFYLDEKRHPTRWDLDVAAPHHPVKLQHRSQHACVLNSLALRIAGIDRSFSPPPGARIELDPSTGEPTGLLYEMGHYLSENIIPSIEDADLRGGLEVVFNDLVAHGITSVQDATDRNGLREWLLLRDFTARETKRPRVTMMVGQRHLAEVAESGLGHGDGGNWLRLGAVKIMLTESADGFTPDQDSLFSLVWEAHRRGYPVAIHAIEESAVCLAIEAIANALERWPRGEHHHRLEHASVVPPALLERMSELGISIVTQPAFIYHSGERYLSDVDDHLHGWLYALRSMLASGIAVAAGSDAPVVPANPLSGIYAAVTRRSRQGQVLGAGEGISVVEALRLHTLAPAEVLGIDTQLGSIQPGRLADLVLLTDNPISTPVHKLGEVRVEMTIVDGRVVFCGS
ncbi:MAG: amidohydrolase [Chloroflexota bacterium]|nr:MAG: amidohydrolase [Chloroflexota bacterium]